MIDSELRKEIFDPRRALNLAKNKLKEKINYRCLHIQSREPEDNAVSIQRPQCSSNQQNYNNTTACIVNDSNKFLHLLNHLFYNSKQNLSQRENKS